MTSTNFHLSLQKARAFVVSLVANLVGTALMPLPARAALNTPTESQPLERIGSAVTPLYLPAEKTFWDEALDSGFNQDLESSAARDLRLRLLDQAAAYAESPGEVPYVWGGSVIGSADACRACKACIISREVGVTRRLQRCGACRQCGVDCSHFVNKVLADIGLKIPYASTSQLVQASGAKLAAQFNLIDIGKDLALARPGDLLLHRRHIVMLLQMHADGRADIMHSTRGQRANQPGGIQVLKNVNLRYFRGPVLKILRHKAFGPSGFGDPLRLRERPRLRAHIPGTLRRLEL